MNAKTNRINKWLSLALCLALLFAALATNVQPASAATVTATLTNVTGDVATFTVSVSNADYVLLQEGNKANEQLKVTATGNTVRFTMKPGNMAMKLDGVTVVSQVRNWQPCVGATDWLCKIAEENAEYDLNEAGKWQDGAMWHVIPAEKLMIWTGGSSYVHVNFNEAAKALLKSGYTAKFTISVSAVVRACRSDWSGMDSNGIAMNPYNPTTCIRFPLRPGTYFVTGWSNDEYCGEQIGFRVVPDDAAAWNETPTCNRCVWPFPIATLVPTYQDAPTPAPTSTPVPSVPTATPEPTISIYEPSATPDDPSVYTVQVDTEPLVVTTDSIVGFIDWLFGVAGWIIGIAIMIMMALCCGGPLLILSLVIWTASTRRN